MVNFITAVAYHFCPSLPAAFTQPGASTLAGLCSLQSDMSCVLFCVSLGQYPFNSMIIPISRPCERPTQLLLFIYDRDGAVEVPSQLCTHVEVNTERCSAFSLACGHQSIDCMFPYAIGSVGCQGNVLDGGWEQQRNRAALQQVFSYRTKYWTLHLNDRSNLL